MSSRLVEALAVILASAVLASASAAQGVDDVREGMWVRAKGRFEEPDLLLAQELEIRDPEDEETLIGTVTSEDGEGFFVLGQPISVSEKTELEDLRRGELEGLRVEVEGHYRGPRKFSSRTVSLREEGRDRVEGRVDAVRREGGFTELTIMRFRVRLDPSLALESDVPLDQIRLAAPRARPPEVRRRDDDDDIPGSIRILDDLYLGLRADWNSTIERDFDLDRADEEDRLDHDLSLRAELTWSPREDFFGLVGLRHAQRWRDDEDDGYSHDDTTRVAEAFGYVRDLALPGLDLQVGRQDFDDQREWLYDENLDAVRVIYSVPDWRVELSAATTLSGASEVVEATDFYMAYVSNNDEDRHIAAYVIDRREEINDDKPFYFGIRALGEWIPDNTIWSELSAVRGFEGDTDIQGYGFDLGTTWKPEFAEPFYLSAGYAFGSGDSDVADGSDGNFRQTGLQDNNDKLGGVTSFRYYGELFDPELSNLHIVTLGVGARFGRRSSIDLVAHRYWQDAAADSLRDVGIKHRPNGVDDDLGWEVDLVYGNRDWEKWDIEVVAGAFRPGDAFNDSDTAYLGRIQVRFRF